MLSLKKKRIGFLLPLVLVVGLVGCASLLQRATADTDPRSVPDAIMLRAQQIVISRSGRAVYDTYIRYDSTHSKYVPPNSYCQKHPSSCTAFLLDPHYALVFSFRVPTIDSIRSIGFLLDLNGDLIEDADFDGLLDCVNEPAECVVEVTEEQATHIAQSAGLEPGIRPWKTSFHWHAGVKTYVWTVQNTLYVGQDRWSGRTALIDANSGELYLIAEWRMMN